MLPFESVTSTDGVNRQWSYASLKCFTLSLRLKNSSVVNTVYRRHFNSRFPSKPELSGSLLALA